MKLDFEETDNLPDESKQINDLIKIIEGARILGSRTSTRKKRTSKANGKKGGRPKGSTDAKPRERRWKIKPED
jgi:hypothetical protein